MRNVQNAYQDANVQIDGQHFERCTFVRCKLVYRGGPRPVFDGCSLVDSTYVFDDAAGRTVAFLQHVAATGGAAFVEQLLSIHSRPPAGSAGPH